VSIELTPEEIRFISQYVRELSLGPGLATQQIRAWGIYYTAPLMGSLIGFWDPIWIARGEEFPYPQQDDLEVICPWASKEALEARIEELIGSIKP
jgi:hypothetical protein